MLHNAYLIKNKENIIWVEIEEKRARSASETGRVYPWRRADESRIEERRTQRKIATLKAKQNKDVQDWF